MKLLLLGAQGQLGQELKQQLAPLGQLKACGREEADLSNPEQLRQLINDFKPDVVINAAAYTAVDKAENDKETALQINAQALKTLSAIAVQQDFFLIHYSTDYVFAGDKKEAYTEQDTPKPINVYGESKLAGEKFILASHCKHLIFRTTWVVGEAGNNFIKTILRLARSKEALSIINDQQGVPTSTDLIAKVTVAAISAIKDKSPWASGIYHLTPRGKTTWYNMARIIVEQAQQQSFPLNLNTEAISPIPTSAYPTPAKRPLNSSLNTSKLQAQLNFALPDWQEDFIQVTQNIIKEQSTHES